VAWVFTGWMLFLLPSQQCHSTEEILAVVDKPSFIFDRFVLEIAIFKIVIN